MANTMYNPGLEGFLDGSYSWTGSAIKAVLLDTGAYTFAATHKFLSDIAAGARISTSAAFASKTATNGVANAAGITFTTVPAGAGTAALLEALAIYYDTGAAGTSRLIAYIDTATGLPVQPNGTDITVAWDTGTNKIFKL